MVDRRIIEDEIALAESEAEATAGQAFDGIGVSPSGPPEGSLASPSFTVPVSPPTTDTSTNTFTQFGGFLGSVGDRIAEQFGKVSGVVSVLTEEINERADFGALSQRALAPLREYLRRVQTGEATLNAHEYGGAIGTAYFTFRDSPLFGGAPLSKDVPALGAPNDMHAAIDAINAVIFGSQQAIYDAIGLAPGAITGGSGIPGIGMMWEFAAEGPVIDPNAPLVPTPDVNFNPFAGFSGGGGGGGPARSQFIYQKPDSRVVADLIRSKLRILVGRADEGRVTSLLDLYFRDHRLSFDRGVIASTSEEDVAELEQIDPMQSVLEQIRSDPDYAQIHSLRPGDVDEEAWLTSSIDNARRQSFAVTAQEATDRGIIGASSGDIAENQDLFGLSKRRQLPSLFQRVAQTASVVGNAIR